MVDKLQHNHSPGYVDPGRCGRCAQLRIEEVYGSQTRSCDTLRPPTFDSARAAIPGMRWWCEPAVDLGPRICSDCFNTALPDCTRCGHCTDYERQCKARLATHIADLYERRAQAVADSNLALALRIDDTLECHYGMPGDNRMTCYQCQDWRHHAHHPLTGERMTLDEWNAYTAARPGIYGS